MPNCKQCHSGFEITDSDRQFYEKLDVPDPTMCPDCRMQRRLTFRNFFNLYHRKCDLTGKRILSMYDQGTTFPVFDLHEWWTDKWDPLDYGLEVDFSKSVFDQLKTLHDTVPRMGIMNQQCENTDYCNLSLNSRNSYLVFGNVENEDCCYGHVVWRSKNCFDCLYVEQSDFCYECVDCFRCNNLSFSQNCENCSDSKFLVDCVSCRDCFGCVGLKNKQYYIFNESYSKEEYEQKMKELNCGDRAVVNSVKNRLAELVDGHKVKSFHGFNCENVTGDYLYNCKNVFDSYDVKNSEDVRYCTTVGSFKDAYDCNYSPGTVELSYNCVAVIGFQLRNCHTCVYGSNLDYSDHCFNCKDCFGCVGLKSKQYCIFNKQYSKEEYEKLVPKIIEYMKSTGEWGEFFPADFSPFAYNETMANDYCTLSKEEAVRLGWRWKDMQIQNNNKKSEYTIPNNIKDVGDDILKQILECEKSGKPYKIIPQELTFYRQQNLPIPRLCPDQRHADRMALRNPRHLLDRKCAKCKKNIKTTYSPDRPEVVYCEQCYLKEVY